MSEFKLVRVPGNPGRFYGVKFGGGMVASIQASEFHYSSPRDTLASSDDYESFEVALLINGEWFHPETDERFQHTDWAKNWSECDDVAGWVIRPHIEQMLEHLRTVFGDGPEE